MAGWFVRNLAPFLVLVVMVRWVMWPRWGKRGPVEILLLNAVGDLASHVVFEEDHPLARGVGSVALWLALAAALAWLMSRSASAGSLLGYFPGPVQIVRDGVPDLEAMRQARVSMVELESELRKQASGDLNGVRSVTMEPDGSVVVQQQDATAKELQRLTAQVTALAAEVRQLRQGARMDR